MTVPSGLIEAIVLNILIPEALAFLRKKPGATDAEVIAALEARRERIMAKGRAFLAETDEPEIHEIPDPNPKQGSANKGG